jgi:hypothetical protein
LREARPRDSLPRGSAYTFPGLSPPYEVHLYPGAGTVDGVNGDHIIIAPSYNITNADIDTIIDRVGRLVEDFFETLNAFTVPSAP